MLHYDDYQWRLAQLEHERLVTAMRASARPTSAERLQKRWRLSWRWSLGLRPGVDELTTYLRSEWARPFAKTTPLSHSGHSAGLMPIMW